MASAKAAIRLSIVVVVIVFSLCSLLSLVRVLYQVIGILSSLQEPVGSCPSEHSTPSCRSDTIGAGDTVANVIGEASDSHCCSFVYPHYTYIIGICKGASPHKMEFSESIFLSLTCPLRASRVVDEGHRHRLVLPEPRAALL
jgi:hypothetical protein